VKLLLDTHTLLWFLRDDPNLSPVAKKIIQDPANHKFVSVASCWEIAIKAGLRRLGLTEPSGVLLSRELPRNGFDLLPIELRHATHVEMLPEHHRDPFDRMLVAQSLLDMIPLVSVDIQLDAYGITRLW
jgi:PIN domain nuclease of toxin-antitoxin system